MSEVNWYRHELRVSYREALQAAAKAADAEVKRAGDLLANTKFTPAAHAHITALQEAAIKVATRLRILSDREPEYED